MSCPQLWLGCAGGLPTCAPDTVHIVLVVVGAVIVDDQNQILHIQAPGSHRGCHQDLQSRRGLSAGSI